MSHMSKSILRQVVKVARITAQKTPGRTMSTDVLQSDLHIEHDSSAKEFFILLKKGARGRGKKAVLQYDYISPTFVDLQHTVVPEEFRGHGVAKILAKTAFDYFAEKEIDMQPTCTYLQKFYKENPSPEYKARVKWSE